MKRKKRGLIALLLTRFGIQGKILISFTLAVSIPFGLLGSFLYSNYEQTIRNNVAAHNEKMSMLLSERVNDFFYKLNHFYYSLYSNNLPQSISKLESRDFDSIRYSLDISYAVNYLTSFYGLDSIVDSVLLVDQKGKILFQSGRYTPDNYIFEENGRFALQEQGGGAWISAPYDSGLTLRREGYDGQHIAYFRPVRNAAGALRSYDVVFEVRLDAVQELMESLSTDFRGFNALVSGDQLICQVGDGELLLEEIQAILPELDGVKSLSTKLRGQQALVSVYPINNTNWQMFFISFEKDLYQESGGLKSYTVMLTLVTFFLSVGISLLLSIGLVNPIKKLKALTYEVMGGKLDVHIPWVSRDEIGDLGRCIDQMLVRTRELLKEKYTMEIRERESQLFALQAQINPHFLYNTLDTIGSIAQDYGVEEVSEISQSMAAMYRYSVRPSGQEVTLGEELAHVQHYLRILKVRYEDRLQVEYNFTPESLTCTVIRLILQPLAENAVYHGIEPRRGGGWLRLSAHCEESVLFLVVEDNGVGIHPQQLKEIQQGLQQYEGPNDGRHIGLQNVYERLYYHFGKRLHFGIYSEEERGTRIEISITRFYADNGQTTV